MKYYDRTKKRNSKVVYNKTDLEEKFPERKKELQKIFGKDILDIQHVGSTAIPKILAKPIIDIGVIVPSLRRIKKYITALKKLAILKKEKRGTTDYFLRKDPKRNGRIICMSER